MHRSLHRIITFSSCIIATSLSITSSEFSSFTTSVEAQKVTPSQWLGTYIPAAGCTPSATCCCAKSGQTMQVETGSQANSITLTGQSDGSAGCQGQSSLSGTFILNSDGTEGTYTLSIISLTATIKRAVVGQKVQLTLTNTKTQCPVVLERPAKPEDGAASSASTPTSDTNAASTASAGNATSTGSTDNTSAASSGDTSTATSQSPSTNDQANNSTSTSSPSNSTSSSASLPDGFSSSITSQGTDSSLYLITFAAPNNQLPSKVILHTSTSSNSVQQTQEMTMQQTSTTTNDDAQQGKYVFASSPISLQQGDTLMYSFSYTLQTDGATLDTQQLTFSAAASGAADSGNSSSIGAPASDSTHSIAAESSTAVTMSSDTSTSGSSAPFYLTDRSPLLGTFASDESSCVPGPRCCCVVGPTHIAQNTSVPNGLSVTTVFHGDVLSCYTLTNKQTLQFTAMSDDEAVCQYNSQVQFTAKYNASSQSIQVINSVHPKCPTAMTRSLSAQSNATSFYNNDDKLQSKFWILHALICVLIAIIWH